MVPSFLPSFDRSSIIVFVVCFFFFPLIFVSFHGFFFFTTTKTGEIKTLVKGIDGTAQSICLEPRSHRVLFVLHNHKIDTLLMEPLDEDSIIDDENWAKTPIPMVSSMEWKV